MTVLPTLLPNHGPTAAELATITTAITRSIPIKGVLVSNTGNPIATTSATTELDMSKYAMTGLTLVAGRYYLYRTLVTYTKTVASDSYQWRLRANTATSGTIVNIPGLDPTGALGSGHFIEELIFKGDPTYTALYYSVTRSSGTGTLSHYGAVAATTPLEYRSWAMLYDLGDSDNWTDAA